MVELTQKQLKSKVRSCVGRLVRQHGAQGGVPTIGQCIQAAEKEVRAHLTELNRPARKTGLFSTREADFDIDGWMLSARKDIQAMVDECLRSALVALRGRDISCTTALALVQGILQEKGFAEYGFREQTRRLKVSVRMPSKRRFTFCVRYSHLQDDLSHVAEGLDAALYLTGLFDKDTTIL